MKYFGLNHQKITTGERVGGQGRFWKPLPPNKVLFFPKTFFYPQNCPFIFQKFPFVSSSCPFFPKSVNFIPEMPFYFSKMPHCFPELSLCFPELLSFYSCARLFFFSSWSNLLLILSRAGQREIFLALAFFPLRTTTYDTFLKTSKHLHRIWFLCILFKFQSPW